MEHVPQCRLFPEQSCMVLFSLYWMPVLLYLLLSPLIMSFPGKAIGSPSNIWYSNYSVEMIPMLYSPSPDSFVNTVSSLPVGSFSNSVKSKSNYSRISILNSRNSNELPSPKTHPKNNPQNSPYSPPLLIRIARSQESPPSPSCNSKCTLRRTIWSAYYKSNTISNEGILAHRFKRTFCKAGHHLRV